MRNKFNKIIFFLTISAFIAPTAFGAGFIINSGIKDVNINDELKVDLSVNTDGEYANAFEGRIVFPRDLLGVKEIRDGNSIVNFWIDRPKDTDNGIIFSGITPGGYSGDKGQLFSVIFLAKKEGSGDIHMEDGKLLKNDGQGSQIPLTVSDFNFSISKQLSESGIKISQVKDTDSPETFYPEVSKDPGLFDGKWFLVFSAEDKGTGIDRYEVRESRYRIFDSSKWIPATSPYVLSDQDLNSYIYVKAYDKVGNYRVVKLSPTNPISWYANIENWFIIALVIVLGSIYYFFLYKKNKK